MPRERQQPTLHPIQVAARRAGVSPDVLRAWEKRYGAVTPKRSDTGRRLYSDDDIARLRLITEAMAGGRRIGDVARLSAAQLEALVAQDREQAEAPSPGPEGHADVASIIAAAIGAVRRADQPELRAGLSRALLTLAPARFINEVATPLMRRVGELWERGELSPGHEHIASEVMRQLLTEVLRMLEPRSGARLLVVATPSGQRHELGALLAATTGALEGWRVSYLGPDLPPEDIGRVSLDAGAAAIALSITAPDPSLPAALSTLRKAVGREMPILAGGQQVAHVNGAASRVIPLHDLESFRAALAAIARS